MDQRGEIQKRWADGQAPPDGADRCAICSRWDGKTTGYDDGSYTVKIRAVTTPASGAKPAGWRARRGSPRQTFGIMRACWTALETVH